MSNFSEHNPFIVIFSKLNIEYSDEIKNNKKIDIDSKINNFLAGNGNYYITYDLITNQTSQYTMMPFFKKYYYEYIENDLETIPADPEKIKALGVRDTLKNKFTNEQLAMGTETIDPLRILVDKMDEETYKDINYKIYKYIPKNIGGDYIDAFKKMFMGHYGDNAKSFDEVKAHVIEQIKGTEPHPSSKSMYANIVESVKKLREKIKAYIDTNLSLIHISEPTRPY